MRHLLLLVLASACAIPASAPQPLVLCHNSNCAHATDPRVDGTIARLDDSLALEYRGRPAIDGIELDIIYDRAHEECLFAHDLAIETRVPAIEAAEHVAAHLARPGDVSWRGDEFFVKIELKHVVTTDGDEGTPDEVTRLLECAFDMRDMILGAARANGRPIELGFDSYSVPVLRAAAANPRWLGKSPEHGVRLLLISNVNADGLEPGDLSSLRSERDDRGIDILWFHATRTPTVVVENYADLGAELMLGMLDIAPETLHAIRVFNPKYANTSEALLLRRWLEQ